MSTISTASKKKRYSLIAVAVMLVTALLGAIGINQASASTIRLTYPDNMNKQGASAGYFNLHGDAWGKGFGICSDPDLVLPPGSDDGSVDFKTYTLWEFMAIHPDTKHLPKTAEVGENQTWRTTLGAQLMMAIHPNLPEEYEHFIWDDLWTSFQNAGLSARYGIDRNYFKHMVVHMHMGILTREDNVPQLQKYNGDITNWFYANVFSNHNNPNWRDKKVHSSWNKIMSQEEGLGARFKDTIRVINPEGKGYQSVVLFVTPFEFPMSGILNLNKTSALKEYTDGNSAYSLEGTQYGVFTDAKATVPAKVYKTNNNAVLTVGADQKANSVELKCGTYYVKEIKASPSYELDSTIHKVKICGNK